MGFRYNALSGQIEIVGSGGPGPGPSFPANYKDPVLTAAALPVMGSDGDVRVVLDEATVYVYSSDLSTWVPQRGPKDIETTTHTILNNQTTPVEINTFKLNNQVTSFEAMVEITMITNVATIKRGVQHIYCSYDGTQWHTATTIAGLDVLELDLTVDFDLGGNPTVRYTTSNDPSFASAQIKFRAKSL